MVPRIDSGAMCHPSFVTSVNLPPEERETVNVAAPAVDSVNLVHTAAGMTKRDGGATSTNDSQSTVSLESATRKTSPAALPFHMRSGARSPRGNTVSSYG